MRDPIRDLERFDTGGTTVDPLPASEVRRRGDRMRRRHTALATVGGVAAALAAVAVPLTLVGGAEPGRDLQPAPATEWRQDVPEGFPLGDDFPTRNASDGTPTRITDRPAYAERSLSVAPCGTAVGEVLDDPGGADVSDVAGLLHEGETEDVVGRTVVVYDDATAAQAAAERLRVLVSDCSSQRTGEDVTLLWDTLDVDLATEDSFGLTQQVRFDDGSVAGLTTTLAGRTGNAVLLLQSYGSAGGPDVVSYEIARLRDRASVPLSAMCVFAADPCAPSEASAGGDGAG